jgi:hypothetical protein
MQESIGIVGWEKKEIGCVAAETSGNWFKENYCPSSNFKQALQM